MRWLIWIIGLAAAAVAVILAARVNEGYLLLVSPTYRVELSLNLAIVIGVGVVVVGYLLVRAAAVTVGMPGRVREFQRTRADKKARSALTNALRNYFEGRYGKAERFAAAATDVSDAPGLAALIGAWSAHGKREYSLRDEYLSKAAEAGNGDTLARQMAQAEMFLDERRYNDALSIISQLPEKHTEALKLELRAQELAHNWDAVLDLLPQLEKRKVFDESLAAQIRRHAYIENVKNKAINLGALREYWSRVPAKQKRDARVAAMAAQCFLSFDSCDDAHKVIEDALEANWDSELVGYYAECLDSNVKKQLERAEVWLEAHPQDPILLLILGKLCAHEKLWGKGQSYLEASLSIEPRHSTHLELAKLYESMGKFDDATAQYRKALEQTLPKLKQATGGRRRSEI